MNQFKSYSSELSAFNLAIIIILGMISFLPLTFYDFILKKRVKIDLDNKKLYKFSFIASSISSIAGFGGSSAIALKSNFYKKYTKDKNLSKEISKIVALNFTGFSFLCLLYKILNLKELFNFTSLMPMYDNMTLSIDLMRFSKDAQSGIMDFIFVNLFNWSKQNSYNKFNMGLAPLSNVGVSKHCFVREKLASQVYLHGSKFYSFKGLKNFKQKYCTQWDSKYIAYYYKDSLVFTVIQIILLLNKRPNKLNSYNEYNISRQQASTNI